MIRMIIVDDEILARVGIQSFFENKAAIQVEGTFRLAADALKFLRESNARVDIVLTDIEMAEMDGLTFIEHIKKEGLARGIIIITCHKDFEYLRKAMKIGADGYILKHEITESVLMDEISKLCKKLGLGTHAPGSEGSYVGLPWPQKDVVYAIGAIKLIDPCDTSGNPINFQVEEVMLQHLLEDIVRRYQMGTPFFPYKRDIFVVFEFSSGTDQEERRRRLSVYADELRKNVQQYVNKRVVLGISGEFRDIQKVPEYYHQAVQASELSFYDSAKSVFSGVDKLSQTVPPFEFAADDFLEDNGMQQFYKSFSDYLSKCGVVGLEVNLLKQTLVEKIDLFFNQLARSYDLTEEKGNENPFKLRLLKAILDAETASSLIQCFGSILEKLYDTLFQKSYGNDFARIFQYIKKNIDKKLTLSEIAELNCMSVPSFCKRFKEETGITLIQYVNQVKIERVKELLLDDKLSLESIAEKVGFSNENYMIRVFKKVTGKTIKDYRHSEVIRRKF